MIEFSWLLRKEAAKTDGRSAGNCTWRANNQWSLGMRAPRLQSWLLCRSPGAGGFHKRAVLFIELHPMCCSAPRLRKLSFGKGYEWNASGSDFTVVGKLLWPLVARAWDRLPGTDASEVSNYFDRFLVVAFANLLKQVKDRPRTHPNLGRPAARRSHLKIWIQLRLVHKHADLAPHDLLQIKKCLRCAVAILHANYVGLFNQLRECCNGNCKFVIVGVVINNNIELRK